MSTAEFRCYLVERDEEKKVTAKPAVCPMIDLPVGDVLIRVAYSSLNFKDGLAATGNPGVVRKFPHIPGIDAAGTVVESQSANFRSGDQVVVTGFALGAPAWGGFAEYIRVPSAWVVPLPAGLSLRQSMIYGTAGFTAAMSVEQLIHHQIRPESGEVVVTGSTGGVGCIAVAILAKLDYRVAAVTGKPSGREFLLGLGASTVLSREEVNDTSGKPLLNSRWVGAVDTVGGNTLATVIRSTDRAGCVTACGLVGGLDLNLTVHPFILRGVCLAGIDSAEYPIERRASLWAHLATDWYPSQLESLGTADVDLDGLPQQVEKILAGQIQGRVLVKLGDV